MVTIIMTLVWAFSFLLVVLTDISCAHRHITMYLPSALRNENRPLSEIHNEMPAELYGEISSTHTACLQQFSHQEH